MKKFTNLKEDLLKENQQVADKFNLNYQDCLRKIDMIKVGLDDIAIKQTNEPGNWGYVGNMVHINKELDNILEFLK